MTLVSTLAAISGSETTISALIVISDHGMTHQTLANIVSEVTTDPNHRQFSVKARKHRNQHCCAACCIDDIDAATLAITHFISEINGC